MIAWQWDVSLGRELLMVGDSPSNAALQHLHVPFNESCMIE